MGSWITENLHIILTENMPRNILKIPSLLTQKKKKDINMPVRLCSRKKHHRRLKFPPFSNNSFKKEAIIVQIFSNLGRNFEVTLPMRPLDSCFDGTCSHTASRYCSPLVHLNFRKMQYPILR